MKKIILGSDMKDVDSKTLAEQNITPLDLMERAAERLTEAILRNYSGGRFFVFAGAGNNGGDALAVARLLASKGHEVSVLHFNVKGELSTCCEANMKRLQEMESVRYEQITKTLSKPDIKPSDVIIDGLFGTGLNKPLGRGFAAVAKLMNGSGATIFSIDMPTGLMCEDNTFNTCPDIVRATKTFALQTPKLVFMFPEYEQYVGDFEVLDIGLSQGVIDEVSTAYRIVEGKDVAKLVRRRKRFAHKGDFGKALIIAGSYGMAGAAILSSEACLRSGVGLLKVHVPTSCVPELQASVPEAIAQPDYHDKLFTYPDLQENFDCIAVGPGIGRDNLTVEAVKQTIFPDNRPMVIDADALNILSEDRTVFKSIPPCSIITPHMKEFDRLLGQSRDTYERLAKAAELAEKFHLFVVLKNAFTIIVTPHKEFYFNSTGNPGMATAGSGDVLTGILASLLAQGYEPLDAALLGTYVHGLAGDIAAEKYGQIAMTAGDIVACLPEAWKNL